MGRRRGRNPCKDRCTPPIHPTAGHRSSLSVALPLAALPLERRHNLCCAQSVVEQDYAPCCRSLDISATDRNTFEHRSEDENMLVATCVDRFANEAYKCISRLFVARSRARPAILPTMLSSRVFLAPFPAIRERKSRPAPSDRTSSRAAPTARRHRQRLLLPTG